MKYVRPLFCQGRGPFRVAALTGDPSDIACIDQIILDTPRLTQYIGVKPEKWSVVDPIFTLVTNQLFKEYASWGGSALAMKEIIAHRIYDHLAQKYQFPDSAQIKQMFAEFSGALNTDYLVRI